MYYFAHAFDKYLFQYILNDNENYKTCIYIFELNYNKISIEWYKILNFNLV